VVISLAMDPDLRRIVDERLARGEIDFEEHRRLLSDLERADGPPRDGGYSVLLRAASRTNKIATIKVVREAAATGLKEAKNLTEAAPVVLADGIDREAADSIVRDLLDVGARAEAVPADSRSLDAPRGTAAHARAQAASGCLVWMILFPALALLAGVLPAVAVALLG